MPIIEVLENRATFGQAAVMGSFTADNTNPNNFVNVTPNANAESGRLVSALGGVVNEWWEPGDNFNLLSIGILIPGLFIPVGTQAQTSAWEVTLVGRDNDNNTYTFYEGFIPWGQYELAIGQYFDVTAAGFTSKWQMYLKQNNTQAISMYGVPDSENTKQYSVNGFVKVQHNDPLSPNP